MNRWVFSFASGIFGTVIFILMVVDIVQIFPTFSLSNILDEYSKFDPLYILIIVFLFYIAIGCLITHLFFKRYQKK